MSFVVLKNKSEWEAYAAELSKDLQVESSGPKTYPALADYKIMLREGASRADMTLVFVYPGDCIQLLDAVDPSALKKTLYDAGQLWAADMVQKGYNDGDGPARFMSQKLAGNLRQFLSELRVLIPAMALEPEEKKRGIDCIIILESLVTRCTEEGHEAVEQEPAIENEEVLGQEDGWRRDISAAVVGLVGLFVERGIFTEKEYLTAKTQALQVVDQEIARLKEDGQ